MKMKKIKRSTKAKITKAKKPTQTALSVEAPRPTSGFIEMSKLNAIEAELLRWTVHGKNSTPSDAKQEFNEAKRSQPNPILTAKQAIRALQRIVKAKGDLPLLARDRGGMNRFVRSVELAVWDARIWCIVVDVDH